MGWRRVVCDATRSRDVARGGLSVQGGGNARSHTHRAHAQSRLLLGSGERRVLASAGVAEPLFPSVGVVGPFLQLDAPRGRLGSRKKSSRCKAAPRGRSPCRDAPLGGSLRGGSPRGGSPRGGSPP